MSFKIFRTSKTKVTNLPSFTSDSQQSESSEPELKREEVALEESSVGDVFEELFGEAGQEVKPEEQNAPKRHVKKDDESDEEPLEVAPAKREYKGDPVEEGVNPSKTSDGENADLDDLISAAMGDMADEDTQPEAETKRSSTPSKDDGGVDDADFGGFLSLIRDDSEQPPPVEDKKVDDKPRDIPVDRKSGGGKPASGSTKTTTSYSFSSKFVPNLPASFFKDIQTKLEDLIFKFECLDNEYAALQKISHKVYIETMDIKKIFSNEN